jgi:hypothetical protein
MGLVISFSICEPSGCNLLQFSEQTGLYGANNLTGYGNPNPATTDAIAAVLTITNPVGVSYNIDLFATGLFPSSNGLITYNIQNTDIGLALTAKIPDGIYTFIYTVTVVIAGVTTIYTQTIVQGFYCQVACCVYSMFSKLNLECSDCNTAQKLSAIDAYLMLKGIIYSANAGQLINFNNDLSTLQRICLNSNCSGCK